MFIETILLVLIIAILLVATIPALEHYKKRSQYREILDIAVPIKSAVEKCLGLTRDPQSCDTDKELVVYGGISVHASSSSSLDAVEIALIDDRYEIILTPPDINSVIPFLNATHTLVLIAEIHDRNGRPVIENWKTDPQSGCMLVGFC